MGKRLIRREKLALTFRSGTRASSPPPPCLLFGQMFSQACPIFPILTQVFCCCCCRSIVQGAGEQWPIDKPIRGLKRASPSFSRYFRYQIPARDFTGRNPRTNSCRILPFLFLHRRNFHVFYGRSIEPIDCLSQPRRTIENSLAHLAVVSNYFLGNSNSNSRFHSRFTSNFLVSRLNKSREKGIVRLK